MKPFTKFNRLFKENETKVKIYGSDDWNIIKEISLCRQWVKINGHVGHFQRKHVREFTNR